jgi:mannose-6-phosphate isomerase-like protein (cupin superfamily)
MSMRVTRADEAEPFHPVGHQGVSPLRLWGGDRTPTEGVTVVLSRYAPGAEAGLAAQSCETVYVVTEGALTFDSEGTRVVLGPMDSAHFDTGTTRTVHNETSVPASMLVIRTKVTP